LKLASLLLVVVVAAGATDKPSDVQGWTATRWGMTEEEILASLPGQAVRLTDPLPKRSYAGGVVVNVGIEVLEVSKIKLKVHFVPDEKGKLRRVLIKPLDRAYAFHFQTLDAILTEKYGTPTFRSTVGNKMISKWSFPTTNIELEFTEFGPRIGSTLVLIYDRKSQSDLDKM
jgi:hypothetical protein